MQVFLDVVGAFCPGGTCQDDAPAHLVSAGLQLTFAACSVLAILGYEVLDLYRSFSSSIVYYYIARSNCFIYSSIVYFLIRSYL